MGEEKKQAHKKKERKRGRGEGGRGVEASGCCYCCPDDVSNVIATSSPLELRSRLQGA